MPFDLILDLNPEDSDHLHISSDRWQDQETTITLITKQIQKEENHPYDPHREPLKIFLKVNHPQTLAQLDDQLTHLSPRTQNLSLVLPHDPPGAKLLMPTISLPTRYMTRLSI